MVCLCDADDEPAELGVDAGVVLEAGGDGLAQRPERERPELHQWQHHRVLSPRRPCSFSRRGRCGGDRETTYGRGEVCCWLPLLFLERKEGWGFTKSGSSRSLIGQVGR